MMWFTSLWVQNFQISLILTLDLPGGGAGGANVSNFPIKYKEIVCSSFCPYN